MALTSQPVVADSGSEELRQLRLQFNALLDLIDAIGAMDTLQDFQTAVQGGVKKVVDTHELPAPPAFPTV